MAKIVKYEELIIQYEEDLELIDSEISEALQKARQSITFISNCLSIIKKHVCATGFSSIEEEIFFFKEIKPQILHKLIYYAQILKIESRICVGSNEVKIKHLQRELKKLNRFYCDNIEFCSYMRNKLSYLDDKYFVRSYAESYLYGDSLYYNADPEFSTYHDYKVALMLANGLLVDYIETAMYHIRREGYNGSDLKTGAVDKLIWTESKTSLVELIYALYETGSINHGKAGIKEIASLFERTFSIELGDCYRHYLELKSRANPTKFIDQLSSSLKKRITEQDAK